MDSMSKGIVFKTRNNEKVYPCPYLPIGSIYLSVNNINPGSIFGGTWERIKDKFLLTAGDTYSAGSTGGASTHNHTTAGHTLTINEMPSHDHNVFYNTNDSGYAIAEVMGTTRTSTTNKQSNQWGEFHVWTSSKGGGASHSHGDTGSSSSMPPYLVVYAWKRVS